MLWLYGKPKWLSILLVTDFFMSVELPIAMWYSHFQSMFDALASTSGLFIQICMILIHCLVFREQFFRFRTFCSSSATFNSISRRLPFVKNFFQEIFSLPSRLAAFRCAAAVSFQPLSADDLYYVTRLDEFCQGFILIFFFLSIYHYTKWHIFCYVL